MKKARISITVSLALMALTLSFRPVVARPIVDPVPVQCEAGLTVHLNIDLDIPSHKLDYMRMDLQPSCTPVTPAVIPGIDWIADHPVA